MSWIDAKAKEFLARAKEQDTHCGECGSEMVGQECLIRAEHLEEFCNELLRLSETEKKLEIAVAALNEINLIRNFKDPAYAFTKARDISYKALSRCDEIAKGVKG